MTRDLLARATTRLVRTVDALPDDAYAGPSLLPGWTRAHVVAHLVLNAEGLAAAVRGVVEGTRVPMYASNEARDADIDTLAGASPGDLRTRLLGSTTRFADALHALPPAALDAVVDRTADGARTFVVGEAGAMRWREVEIHHVDLDAGYTRDEWPGAFRVVVVEQLAARAPATLIATDLDRAWQGDDGVPTVSGSAADLGWWLTGRGTGEGLTTDGELPQIGAW